MQIQCLFAQGLASSSRAAKARAAAPVLMVELRVGRPERGVEGGQLHRIPTGRGKHRGRRRAEPEHERGGVRRAAELAEVLSGHGGRRGGDFVLAEVGLERGGDALREGGIVVVGRVAAGLDGDERLLRRAGRRGFGFRDAGDRGEDALPDLGLEGSHRQLESRLVGNDVVGGPAPDRADGHHGRLERILLASHDRLERDHDARGDDDGVDRQMRRRAVASLAVDRDVDAVGVGVRKSRRDPERAGRKVGHVMKREGEVRPAEPLEKSVFQHRRRAAAALLGRLADEDQRAPPFILHRREQGRRADERRDVDVVAAAMHDLDGLAPVVLAGRDARVGQPGLLLQRQSVHVGAQEHRGSLAVLQHRDHAGLADSGRHLVAERAKLFGQLRRGAHFLIAELRIAMQVLVEHSQLGVQGLGLRRLGRLDEARRERNGDDSEHERQRGTPHR